MRPEDVARSLQFRDGFRLVDFGEVGLPVFRLTLEAVTMAHRSMPTIQEFVMRCLGVGEVGEVAVARMLGLKQEVVAGAINALVSDGYVARQTSSGTEPAFKLTDAGEARLEHEREFVPQEEMLVIDYDAIRRAPFRLAGESVVRASELAMSGAVQIRPYPAEPPSIEELPVPEVTKVIRRQGGDDFRRTVLALKRVARRNNVFREAVALVYANDKTGEVQVAFALDGKLSESHERAFAENSGPRKMGFLRAIDGAETRRSLEKLVGKTIIRRLPDDGEFRSARKEEAEAAAESEALRALAERVVGKARSTNPTVAAQIAAEERLQVARFALDSFEVRPLACFEISDLLDEALHSARQSLIVTSAGMQGTVLNGFRLRAIDKLIADRVSIDVETFLTPEGEARGTQYDPLSELAKRAQRGSLSLRQGSSKSFFFLVQDDDLAVVSSRPILGEVSRRNGFTKVEGIVTRRAALVKEIRAIALQQKEIKRNGR